MHTLELVLLLLLLSHILYCCCYQYLQSLLMLCLMCGNIAFGNTWNTLMKWSPLKNPTLHGLHLTLIGSLLIPLSIIRVTYIIEIHEKLSLRKHSSWPHVWFDSWHTSEVFFNCWKWPSSSVNFRNGVTIFLQKCYLKQEKEGN